MGEQVALGVLISFGAILVIVLAVVTIGGYWNNSPSGGGGGSSEARDDVRITNCGLTAAGNLSAELTVTNSTNRARDYFVTVTFTRDGTQLGSGTAVIQDLQPGQHGEDEVVAFVRNAPSSLRCAVTKVNRI
jgi:hypothetical protein